MMNFSTVLVVALMVGICSSSPRVRSHRQTVDEDNSLAAATDSPAAPTLAPRLAVDSQQEEDVDNNSIDTSAEDNRLGLPSNATSIRANIADSFSCEDRVYGYYADVENECQIFHVCLPVALYAGKTQVFKWSFICPAQTIFNQESFTCTRPEDSVACDEAPQYYRLNENFGVTTPRSDASLAPRSGVASVDAEETEVTTQADEQS